MAATRKRLLIMELIFVVFCAFVAFIIMPRLCKRLGFSYFYQIEIETLQKLVTANTQRTQKAEKYFKDHNLSHLFNYYNLNRTEYCFIIITTQRRSNPHYLSQTTAKLVQQLALLTNYTFAIYNSGGTRHKEAIELSRVVPVIHNKDYKEGDRYEREKRDYVSGLKWCLGKKSRYNVILEDDAFPDSSFVTKLKFLLKYSLHDKDGITWGFIKLFYPEKFQGWGDHLSCIVELLLTPVILGLVLTGLSAVILQGPISHNGNSWRINASFYWRLLLSMTLVLFILLTLGRPHWDELKKMSPLFSTVVNARGCCSPAVLYPRTHLASLVNYLEATQCSNNFPVDLALDVWIDKEKLKKLLVIPNMVYHIGLISSLPKGMKSYQEFELLFPPKM